MTTRRRHSLLRVLSLEDRTVPSTVQGTVFNDANHNGVLDAGETGLSGWAAYLDRNQNGIIDPGETTAITDAAGNYFFDTTNEAPALVAYGDVYDAVAVKLEVGTGGRYLDTTARGNYAGRITQPNAVLNFGTFFQPTVGVAPAGPETLVNATAAGVQGGASVSADAAGDYVIAWNTDQPGVGHAIVARIFNADGTPPLPKSPWPPLLPAPIRGSRWRAMAINSWCPGTPRRGLTSIRFPGRPRWRHGHRLSLRRENDRLAGQNRRRRHREFRRPLQRPDLQPRQGLVVNSYLDGPVVHRVGNREWQGDHGCQSHAGQRLGGLGHGGRRQLRGGLE